MARGSLAGIVSGVVVSGLALGVASLSLPPVEMGATAPDAGADGPVAVAPEGSGAPGSESVTDTGMAPETPAETAPEAASDAAQAPGQAPGQASEQASDKGEMPDAEVEPTDAVGESMDAADAPAAPESAPDAAEPDMAAAPEPEPVAEPLTGDESGADAATAPAQEVDETPMRGEAAEAEITPQPAGTPLPETDRAPQMESDPVKAPMAEPVEPAAIPGMELVEKLPPALPPAGPDGGTMPDETDAGDVTAPALPPDTTDDKAPGSALVIEPEPAPVPETVPETAVAPAPTPQPEAAPAAQAEAAPETAPAAQAEAAPETAPEIATIVAEPAPAPAATRAPAVRTPEAAPEPAPEPGLAPAPGLSGADKVVTGRLPTIGDEPAEAEPQADEPAADADAVAPDSLPAIERNRIEFAAEGDQPLLSLLLLDSGDRAALEDIGKLPFPLTVAVDAGAPDAAEAIEFYAARGIEVALLLPLPEGATPADVDVTVEAYKPLLDEAAEVVVDSALGFQALGSGAVQLATNLAESGHGLVSFPSGLNTGHKSALKQGVPAGLVFLDLDGDGQGAPVIRRFLDNAAFRARNEDGVIVLARTRPETLQALLDWSLGSRAQTVTLAPISAVLLSKE